MDKIWNRKSFEVKVIGRCGRDEKKQKHSERTKVER